MPQIDLKCVSFDWSDQRWVVYPFRPGLLAIGFWASISTNDSLLATLEPMAPIGVATNQPRSTISETFSPILIISDDSFASIHVNTDLEEHFLKKNTFDWRFLVWFWASENLSKCYGMKQLSRQFDISYDKNFLANFDISDDSFVSIHDNTDLEEHFLKKNTLVWCLLVRFLVWLVSVRNTYSKSESWIENLRKCYYGTKQLSRQFYISDDSFA